MSKTFTYVPPHGGDKHPGGAAKLRGVANGSTTEANETHHSRKRADQRGIRRDAIRLHKLPLASLGGSVAAGLGPRTPGKSNAADRHSRGRALARHLRAIAKTLGTDGKTLRKELSGIKNKGKAAAAPKSSSAKSGSNVTRVEYFKRAIRNAARALLGAKHTASAAH